MARCLPSKVSGGARNADEVIAQITISAMKPELRVRADAGDKRQRDEGGAGQRGQYADEQAEPADEWRDLVGGDAHRGIGDGEDRLVQHQDQDHGRRRDPDLARQVSADR